MYHDMDEINALQIEGMLRFEKLNALVGGYINLEYRLLLTHAEYAGNGGMIFMPEAKGFWHLL